MRLTEEQAKILQHDKERFAPKGWKSSRHEKYHNEQKEVRRIFRLIAKKLERDDSKYAKRKN